jgi:hypothetical protein
VGVMDMSFLKLKVLLLIINFCLELRSCCMESWYFCDSESGIMTMERFLYKRQNEVSKNLTNGVIGKLKYLWDTKLGLG